MPAYEVFVTWDSTAYHGADDNIGHGVFPSMTPGNGHSPVEAIQDRYKWLGQPRRYPMAAVYYQNEATGNPVIEIFSVQVLKDKPCLELEITPLPLTPSTPLLTTWPPRKKR